MPMATFSAARSLLLGACAGGLLILGSTTAPSAVAAALDGVKAPGSSKDSPYAAAKDDTQEPAAAAGTTSAIKAMGGTRAAGSSKDSPYAAAKDENQASVEPALANLWRLVLPVGLAAGSYLWLRSRDRLEEG